MCGRFTLTVDPGELEAMVPGATVSGPIAKRFNIAPTQPVAVIANTGESKLDYFVWGLIPSWAKDPTIGSRMINARSETLAEKPAFRTPFRRKRCLILADGFYEWKKSETARSKQPMYIYLKSRQPFAFAGLWDTWFAPDGSEVRSCTIITTQPNELVQSIHNRMPVILPREAYGPWLDPQQHSTETLSAFLRPYPAIEMAAHPVSTLVNKPENDLPDCIRPI
jgi:putative SOS response-associated peptidase YedK